jgi:hypothetical protein
MGADPVTAPPFSLCCGAKEAAMANTRPVLNQLNLVARDFDATVEFYRRLGVDVPRTEVFDGGVRHAEVRMPNGVVLEFDNLTLARGYNAAWRRPQGSSRALLGFSLPSREAVDQLYAELVAAGYEGRQVPYTQPVPAPPGTRLEADFGDLGRVSVAVAAAVPAGGAEG